MEICGFSANLAFYLTGTIVMLVDFTVENFRSFREEKRFSLVAAPGNELPENVIELPGLDLRLLRTAAIYGPNASGKSNLLLAMNCLCELLETPVQQSLFDELPYVPFALDRNSSQKPTHLSVKFVAEEVLYEYSVRFRLDSLDEERLTAYPNGRPQEWYHRRDGIIHFNRTYLKGQKRSLKGVTPKGKLFLAVAAAFGHTQLSVPARWLAKNLRNRLGDSSSQLDSRLRHSSVETTSRRLHDDHSFKEWAISFLHHADLGIEDVQVKLFKGTEYARTIIIMKDRYELRFFHAGDDNLVAEFALSDESRGTFRLFSMLAPLYDVLTNGELAVVDELSASMHPSMVREIIRLFHDPKTNPKGAQLVFATHDATLLSGELFRRDQVWFTKKARNGATSLYSLHDFKGVREDEAFEKGYLRGRYGAIPFFDRLDFPEVATEKETRKGASVKSTD